VATAILFSTLMILLSVHPGDVPVLGSLAPAIELPSSLVFFFCVLLLFFAFSWIFLLTLGHLLSEIRFFSVRKLANLLSLRGEVRRISVRLPRAF